MSEYPKLRAYNWRSLKDTDENRDQESGGFSFPYFKSKRSNRYRSSLGWGSELSDYYTDYYSNRFLGYGKRFIDSETVKKAEQLITKAYAATRDMIVILNFPYKVTIQLLTNKDEEKLERDVIGKNNRRVFIPTIVLNDGKKEDSEKINIMCGLGIHESAHLLNTEFVVIKSFKDSIYRDSKLRFNEQNILLDIVNILEDSRVEDKLLIERPGFLDFIENSKKWSYERFNSLIYGSSYDFIKAFYSFLRFPEFIDENVLKEHSEFFSKISAILIEDLPNNTKDICKLSKRIFNVLLEEKKDLLPLDYNGSKNTLYQEVLYGFDVDSEYSPDGNLVCDSLQDSEILKNLVYGKSERGFSENSYFTKMSGNKENYNECYRRIRKYIPSVKNVIKNIDKNYSFNIYGCRSGLLDTTKLAEAYQGVPQVYIRQGQVVTNRTTVCVLVDESGSMYTNDKDDLARDAAILLNEALGSLPGVDLYIYGHSADEVSCDSVDIRVYREGTTYKPLYSLSELAAREQNRDGDAILEVAKRIRKYTDDRCIMFVISDGSPCAGNYYGEEARLDTRKKVLQAEKLNFDIIQISIDTVKDVKSMFDKYIDIKNSLGELPKKLSGIVKKVIADNKNTVII